jgi:hypothetical protein
VFLTGIGALVLGIPLMLLYRIGHPRFFRGETIPKANALTEPVEVRTEPPAQLAG